MRAMAWIQSVDYWHWWVLAVVFVVVEILLPSTFFLWLAIGAGITGLGLLLWPDGSWEYQLLLFSAVSVLSYLLFRGYLRRNPIPTDHPTLNRRGEQYVARTFTLAEPVVNGRGRIIVDDSTWKIEGRDCPAGTRIRITAVKGTVLEFETDGD